MSQPPLALSVTSGTPNLRGLPAAGHPRGRGGLCFRTDPLGVIAPDGRRNDVSICITDEIASEVAHLMVVYLSREPECENW